MMGFSGTTQYINFYIFCQIYTDSRGMASEAYFTMGEISDPAELAKMRKALVEYCGQDTLGLIRLLEKLRSMEDADAKG